MSFLWPTLLWLLWVVPVLALLYARIARHKRQQVLAYAGLTYAAQPADEGAAASAWSVLSGLPSRSDRPVTPAAAKRPRLQWVAPTLFLLGLAILFFAAARPTAVVMVPRLNQIVILALDSSLSMRAGDIKPSRLEAVQAAARQFIHAQLQDTQIGIVTFAATASVVQPPTTQHDDALGAVERMRLQKGTAIGSAILVALGVLFPEEDLEQRLDPDKRGAARSLPGAGTTAGGLSANGKAGRDRGGGAPPATSAREPVAPGSYEAAAIVVVTDGQSTVGPAPAEVAKIAADLGVRVYTVGIGTADGEVIEGEGWKLRVKLDEAILKDVAAQTRGEFYLAESSQHLNRISSNLGTRFVLERKETEVTSWFAAAGALLTLLAAGLSLKRYNRIL